LTTEDISRDIVGNLDVWQIRAEVSGCGKSVWQGQRLASGCSEGLLMD